MKSEFARPAVPLTGTRCVWLSGLLLCLQAQAAAVTPVQSLADLPQAVSNNAVALVPQGEDYRLVSALGLGAGKKWQDSSSDAFQFVASRASWRRLEQVPGAQGRLAAAAVTVAGRVYVFGGYTVAQDGTEQSTPEVYLLDEASGAWTEYSRMPVAVEDSVVLGYQDRYVYLVSGWHDVGNVNLVQVLDTQTAQWQQATPYPGAAVFGHAGGMADGTMLVCDGVRIDYPADGTARQFKPSSECWLGPIDRTDHRRIHWRPVRPHPGQPRYRMAAGADDAGQVWFVGGAANPYNYDGIGYDGEASEPVADVLSYDARAGRWQCHGQLAVASMDHRGLPWHAGWFYVIGGMRTGQQVSSGVFRFQPPPAGPC